MSGKTPQVMHSSLKTLGNTTLQDQGHKGDHFKFNDVKIIMIIWQSLSNLQLQNSNRQLLQQEAINATWYDKHST